MNMSQSLEEDVQMIDRPDYIIIIQILIKGKKSQIRSFKVQLDVIPNWKISVYLIKVKVPAFHWNSSDEMCGLQEEDYYYLPHISSLTQS